MACWAGVVGLLASPLCAQGVEDLSSPQGLEVHQIDYGGSPAVRLFWSNPELYDSVEISVDGEPRDALHGSAGRHEIDGLIAGTHVFGVQGVVGSRRSVSSDREFDVRSATPLTEPVADVLCEFRPDLGGRLVIMWLPGSQEWVAGRASLSGDAGGVDLAADDTAVEIPVSGEGPFEVELRFRDAAGYFSAPLPAACVTRVPAFRRGDCDGNLALNLTDVVLSLNHLFKEDRRWFCDDACDSNDDGLIDIADPVWTLSYLFRGGEAPPSPGPAACGLDPTADHLGGVCDACVADEAAVQ